MLRARLSSIANASTPVVSRGNIPACTFSTQNIYSGTYYLSRSFWPTRPQTTSNLGPCGKPLEHVRFFAAKSKHSKRSKKRKDEQPERQHVPAYVGTLIQLRDAITDGNVKGMIGAYSLIRDQLRLGGEDVAAMAQSLHTVFRTRSRAPTNDPGPVELFALADVLVADIRDKKLPPSHAAHLHLLAFYRESQKLEKGIDFWNWLLDQDDSYVNPAVYGVALELLAIQGKSADETELLYHQALKRFPGSFNEYHLSPDAILPDRTKMINLSGIPVTLLQGILTARLLRGDSRSAYLTLDTALRLFPAQLPSRFFTLFVQERPITEAYKVFLMACRSGTALGPDSLRMLLSKLRHAAALDPLSNASALRSMLTASYAYTASGASLTGNHLTELVIAITSILQHPLISHISKENVGRLADYLLLLVNRLFGIWTAQSARPGIAAFNSIITNLAGKARRKDIIDTCLADMQHLSLQPTIVTHRSLLTAAGEIGDGDMLQSAWHGLSQSRRFTGASNDWNDWQALAKAAKKAAQTDFALEKLQKAEPTMPAPLAARIHGLLEEQTRPLSNESNESDEQVKQLIGVLLRDTIYMEDQLESARFRDFQANPLPLSPLRSDPYRTSNDQLLRDIYDDLTTDKSFQGTRSTESDNQANDNNTDSQVNDTNDQANNTDEQASLAKLVAQSESANLASQSESAGSPTGFDYGELRYQNWKTINELLEEAEQHDTEFMSAVDAAIQKGVAPPKRGNYWTKDDVVGSSIGLSDLESSKHASEETPEPPKRDEDLRGKILRLRGRVE